MSGNGLDWLCYLAGNSQTAPTIFFKFSTNSKFYLNFQVYTATIIDNIPFNPASPIIQLLAEDADIGKNGALYFYIIGGNEKGQFKIDNSKGIIYPNTSFVGQKGATFELTVQVYDEAGTVQAWTNPDQAIIAISVENVSIKYHSRFFDCLAHPNLSATFATDQK